MVFFLIYFFLLKLIILESFHIIVSTFIGMNKTVGSLDFISFTFYDFFLEVNELLRSCTTATVYFMSITFEEGIISYCVVFFVMQSLYHLYLM